MRIIDDDRSAETHNPRMRGVPDSVHEYIDLVGCQWNNRRRLGVITCSFEASVNHVTGVEVAEALCDIGELEASMSVGQSKQE